MCRAYSWGSSKQDLGANIAGEAGKLIVQKFEDANAEAGKAVTAFRSAAKLAIWPGAVISFLTVVFGIAVAAWLIMPDAEKVHALQMEEAALRANIEEWRRMEGAGVLSKCGPKERRCVRTDESAEKLFGDRGETYRIIYGY